MNCELDVDQVFGWSISADNCYRLAGANSATSLGQTPMQNVGMDEVDRYPRDVGADKHGLAILGPRR